MALQNGALIADRYRLIRLIATGGMGQVWEADDTRLGRRVAVKVLKSEFSTDPEFLERFRTEARTTARLNHPGIAGIYDYGETSDASGDSTAYLVMELVSGEPLNTVLSRVGRLAVPYALDMLEQTGRALQVAHEAGVVHRDVKPGNILITPQGQVKITDFGIAKAIDASPVTRTGMVMGTAQYIAPEQAMGQDATSSSDVYSLGVVGYEALSGTRPFTGDGALTVAMKHVRETPPPLPAGLAPNIRELIEITMSKEPESRYATGGEFADAVAAVRAGRYPPQPGTVSDRTTRVIAPPPPPPTDRTRAIPPTQQTYAAADTAGFGDEPGKKGLTSGQKAVAWAAGGLLLLAVLIAGGLLLLGGGGDDDPAPAPTTSTLRTLTTAPTTTFTTTYEPPPTTQAPPPVTTTPPPVTTTTTEPPVTTTTTEPPVTTTAEQTTTEETTPPEEQIPANPQGQQ